MLKQCLGRGGNTHQINDLGGGLGCRSSKQRSFLSLEQVGGGGRTSGCGLRGERMSRVLAGVGGDEEVPGAKAVLKQKGESTPN